MILGLEELGSNYHCGLHSLEVPVSSGSQLQHSSCSYAAHVGAKCGGSWKAEHWCETTRLPENKEVVIGGSRAGLCIDTEGIALYIDLRCSPCDDDLAEFADRQSRQQISAAAGPTEGGIVLPALPTGSHEQLKMTSQAELSQRSESKIVPSLSSLRAYLETDNGPRFKRWRQVTAVDSHPNNASYVLKQSELLPSSVMSTFSINNNEEGLMENAPGRDVKVGLAAAGLAAQSEFLKDSGDQHRNCGQGEESPPCLIVEKTECKTPVNPGSHALRALLEADDVHKLKRRRLTTPADSAPLKDSRDVSDCNSPDFLIRLSSELIVAKEIECPAESLMTHDSDGLPVTRSSAESDAAQDAADIAGSENCSSEMASSGKGKTDSASESSSGSQENSPLDKYISRPSRFSGGSVDAGSSRKKEWLAGQQHQHQQHLHHHHHHGGGGSSGKGGCGVARNLSFADNVGLCYRKAIDGRPAAQHPGFVGDGDKVQFCRVCGEREDATSSLICDSCDEVFHMACINVRMKIVPRVDEWLCRPCKKKRKMSKENDQADFDHGAAAAEPKDWWRDDSVIGRVERELLRMNNGRRMKVRLGPKFQADVPDWAGVVVDEVDLDDNL